MNTQVIGNLKVLPARKCALCGELFTPKPGGYNALYCSTLCKTRTKRRRLKQNKPEQLVAARRRSYLQTKKHKDRHEKHKSSVRNSRLKVRQWLADYKIKKGCVDCGYKEHFSALQLDHEGEKSVEIADARSSISRLKEEIEKGNCVVRCANCHSIKTWERKQIGRGCGEH